MALFLVNLYKITTIKVYYFFGIAILVLLFSACDSNEIEPKNDYITFDVDGKSTMLNSYYGVWNTYYLRDNQDQLGIVLQDEKGELLGEIYLEHSDLLNKNYPFTVDKQSDPLNDGFAQMSLLNLTIKRDIIFDETDDVNYTNHSGDNFTLTINSFDNNVLKGQFKGELKTKTGKSKLITNGKFNVKVSLVTSY